MPAYRMLACCALMCAAAVIAEHQRPNVIIIYGDDVGFGDVGINGSVRIPTPNIDRLAAGGLNFTDGHCSAATCTPSRFSMLTGILAFRHHAQVLPPDAPLLIPLDKLTLPQLFKRAGYHTAVIGKWHLGLGTQGVKTDWNSEVKPGPLEVGFDYSFLLPSTNDRVPCVYLRGHRVAGLDPADPLHVGMSLEEVRKGGGTPYPDGRTNREAMTYYPSTHGHNDSVINGIGRIGYQSGGKAALWNDETISDVFVEEMRRYVAGHKDAPFFLYFASQCIHVPRAPNPRFHGRSGLGYRGDSMVEFDWVVGEIMQTLDEQGLADDTIVIFSSDNGPVYDDGYADGTTLHTSIGEEDRGHDGSGIWRGGKYQIYEGGTRVPFIVRWPSRIKPGTSTALVNQIDFMASFARLFGLELADGEGIDSRDTLAAFLGEDPDGLRYMVEEASGLALRSGNWKYVEPQQVRYPQGLPSFGKTLFNLADDPSEQRNIADQHPEKTAQLSGVLQKAREGGVRQAFD